MFHLAVLRKNLALLKDKWGPAFHIKDHRQLLPDYASRIRHCKRSQGQATFPASVGPQLHRPASG
jgi:hypothetical protein